jgi:putative phage-type endonuclease
LNDLDWAEAPIFSVGKKEPEQSEPGDETRQGSEAWLRWRNKGLGSSDAAVLLGTSPWKTATELWQEKKGLWKPKFGWAQKQAMERGKRLEPCVRRLYEAWAGTLYPDATAEHPQHKFMRVSYDGINMTHGRLIEIKCPNQKDHELALMGELPSKYMPQVQWQLMISGLPEADYVSYNGPDAWLEQAARDEMSVEKRRFEMLRLGNSKHMARVRVLRDEAMIAELSRRAVLFWETIEKAAFDPAPFATWTRPIGAPVVIDQAETQVLEQSVEALVAMALEAKDDAARAEARYDALKEKLKRELGDRSELVVGEAQMRWTKRKGAVDYGKIPQLKELDLEQYRKPETKVFEFKRREAE